MNISDLPKLLTAEQTAEVLGVSLPSLRLLGLHAVRVGKTWMYVHDLLDEALREKAEAKPFSSRDMRKLSIATKNQPVSQGGWRSVASFVASFRREYGC